MSTEAVLWALAGQALYMVIVLRVVFRLGRVAERQDVQVRAGLRAIDVDREAEAAEHDTAAAA